MKKENYLREIQKRLPNNIVLKDDTSFDFTEDEFVGILSWIKFFNKHYKQNGKQKYPEMVFPLVSKRLRLDFSLYLVPSTIKAYKGKYLISLSDNREKRGGIITTYLAVDDVIETWLL